MKTALKVLNELVAEKVIKDYAIGGAMGKNKFELILTKFNLARDKAQ